MDYEEDYLKYSFREDDQEREEAEMIQKEFQICSVSIVVKVNGEKHTHKEDFTEYYDAKNYSWQEIMEDIIADAYGF